ncbi:MAG: DUF3786 domain-containing protein [Nitrospirae bacterium]|nr:MAG: DUF3786 domain-containing protein [Nitrospirota bacterium]
MNVLELYKKLPKTNCGRCSQKACMPFAVAVVKGDSDLAECPALPAETVSALGPSLVQGDWREELILKLSKEVQGLDFRALAGGIGAELMDDGSLALKCLGRDFTVSPDGTIKTPGRTSPWIKILLLHYIRTAGREPLAGRWVSYSELRAGMVKASSFLRDCEEPLLQLLTRAYDKTVAALMSMGAAQKAGFPTPHAWAILLLPRVPVLILYWPEEDDFPAKAQVLFDATADRFLDAEALIFLGEGLVRNLEMMQH